MGLGSDGQGIFSPGVLYVQPSLLVMQPPLVAMSPNYISSDEESLSSCLVLIKYDSKMGYAAYESAPPEVRFSYEYIEQLTVSQIMSSDFNIPPALPDGAIDLVRWSVEEPTRSQLLLIDGKIPSLHDTRVFLGDQPAKFQDGYRSVVLQAKGKILPDWLRRSRSITNTSN